MKHVVPFYPIVCQTPKEDFFNIGREVAGGEIISSKSKSLVKIMKEIRGEVVHAHGRGFPFPEMCAFFAKKSIYSPHNDTIGSNIWTKFVRRIIFNRYNKIIVQTEYGKKNLIKEGVDRKKIVVIPNPVDYKFFSKHKNGKEFREKFSIGKREKLAISIGIRKIKNPDIIAKACKESGIRLILVGPRTKKEAMEAWKDTGFDWYLPPEEIKLMDNVILTGQLQPQELLQAFDSSSIFINSSSYENFGLAVYEAASSGLPLCLPNQGTFEPFKKCALFHRCKDVKQLSKNINKYLDNPKLMKSNGEKSRIVAKNVDYYRVKDILEKFYRNFI